MTSRLPQPEPFDDITTAYYDDEVIIDLAIDEDIPINDTLATALQSAPCGSNCYRESFRDTSVEKTSTPSFGTGVIISLVMLVVVIAICIIIAFRHLKHSQKQQKRGHLQSEKVRAHPFEEIAIVVNDGDVIELPEMASTPMISPTGTTTN